MIDLRGHENSLQENWDPEYFIISTNIINLLQSFISEAEKIKRWNKRNGRTGMSQAVPS